MQISSVRNPVADLRALGIENASRVFYQLSPEELAEQTVARKQGVYANSGALAVNTGKYTGRSPKDKFIVKDAITTNTVNWNDFNNPISEEHFDRLYQKITKYFTGKEVWVRDCYACADQDYRVNIKVITALPWSNLFAYNMFLRPTEDELASQQTEWVVIQAPECLADPATDGTRQDNFSIVSFTKKVIIIGGSAYTGEIKKGIFTVLNYILPHDKKVLSMHCSANMGDEGDSAVFFGLSGTGKTTLSADPDRKLIGDDEHGWTSQGIFNFEGGCYAKVIDLSAEKEPEIFGAIRKGSLLENVTFFPGTDEVNYADKSITENTRVSYPLEFISNARIPSVGSVPKNIFFLTCDASGVLPPIARLTPGQAMYQFISGYTAKVAGTEAGIIEPTSTFSACFGAPFLPLHPAQYAQMLGEKMREHNVHVWLINTGWTGGPYGTGNRIKLKYTRALITAALNGQLDNVTYQTQEVFGFAMPDSCPDVPAEILNPRNTWADKAAYDVKVRVLAEKFITNFEKYSEAADKEILAAAPVI
ncbi:phosphoenolpyruvate carboxykinase (ATP) [Chitinophaga silvatica]|uniref:Phosphoenolpyruvate carboxykinase (ATP) n=1 Tax=Chitinophaga silvatica TaxID=2282649 RepID=A0A3E1YE68_9BACT|nr:phosphoenolpyruvate carboxykinase (ATP) [Chitinophaga silvatica]RFS24587.1 phosphoenolpyruvate carboxykinase (ATP) [Chitinophaga silvatica]